MKIVIFGLNPLSFHANTAQLILTDCESTGGTFVEEQKIDSIRLEDGLEVVVGPAVLKFYDSGI
jgi:hypothetical protein